MSENKNINDVINNIFQAKGKLSNGYNQHTIEEVWRQTFGDVISSYTTKVIYKNEILTVFISSSPLKEEIMMNRESVLLKLNSNLKYRKVTQLILR